MKRILRSGMMQAFAGILIANYLRFVYLTSRVITEPDPLYAKAQEQFPFILSSWHGQQFLSFFFRPKGRMHILASLHRDGHVIAKIVTTLGLEVIRGSGSTGRQVASKGGASAFRGMLRALKQGDGVGLTADVPKVARQAGSGIITLAQMSGRPIFPFAILPSKRHVFKKSWDKAFIPLPFSRIAVVLGDALNVPKEADAAEVERLRDKLEQEMGRVTALAYALVANPDKTA